jgi:NAD(P)-dependent dehydrogenase (short-subunit alcohol dehydrogenase family)
VALVTGAGMSDGAHGIGAASASVLAQAGFRVAVVDIDPSKAKESVESINAGDGVATALVGDVAISHDVSRIVGECTEHFGRVDVLVNNVAIGVSGGLMDISEQQWEDSLKINLSSLFLMTRTVVPQMLALNATDGSTRSIINIGAVAGRRWTGVPMIAYSTSKGAIEPFTRSVALEFAGRGIRSNCVLPGLMDTPFYKVPLKDSYEVSRLDDIARLRDLQSPTGAMGTAWDVAHTVAFLASPSANYINGQALVVDGGQSAQTWAGKA